MFYVTKSTFDAILFDFMSIPIFESEPNFASRIAGSYTSVIYLVTPYSYTGFLVYFLALSYERSYLDFLTLLTPFVIAELGS